MPPGDNIVCWSWVNQVNAGLAPCGIIVSGCDRRRPSHGRMVLGCIENDVPRGFIGELGSKF